MYSDIHVSHIYKKNYIQEKIRKLGYKRGEKHITYSEYKVLWYSLFTYTKSSRFLLYNSGLTQRSSLLNTLRPRQNGHLFTDAAFKCIFLNENIRISIKISLKFVPRGPINNIPTLVQVIAWRRPGDKPLSEPMMVTLPTHICVTRSQ